jgi:hypothetical protein
MKINHEFANAKVDVKYVVFQSWCEIKTNLPKGIALQEKIPINKESPNLEIVNFGSILRIQFVDKHCVPLSESAVSPAVTLCPFFLSPAFGKIFGGQDLFSVALLYVT